MTSGEETNMTCGSSRLSLPKLVPFSNPQRMSGGIIGHLDGVCSSFVDILHHKTMLEHQESPLITGFCNSLQLSLTPGWRTNDDDCLWIDLGKRKLCSRVSPTQA